MVPHLIAQLLWALNTCEVHLKKPQACKGFPGGTRSHTKVWMSTGLGTRRVLHNHTTSHTLLQQPPTLSQMLAGKYPSDEETDFLFVKTTREHCTIMARNFWNLPNHKRIFLHDAARNSEKPCGQHPLDEETDFLSCEQLHKHRTGFPVFRDKIRRGSRILVRGPPRSFDPKGGA